MAQRGSLVMPATIDGVLKMPAPITMPTMMATASRRLSSGCGSDIVSSAMTALLFRTHHGHDAPMQRKIAFERTVGDLHARRAQRVVAIDEAEEELVAL